LRFIASVRPSDLGWATVFAFVVETCFAFVFNFTIAGSSSGRFSNGCAANGIFPSALKAAHQRPRNHIACGVLRSAIVLLKVGLDISDPIVRLFFCVRQFYELFDRTIISLLILTYFLPGAFLPATIAATAATCTGAGPLSARTGSPYDDGDLCPATDVY
jgi:hypothetical protein